MSMKYAVVPIEGVFSDGGVGADYTALDNVFTDGDQFFIKKGNGKLTREQVRAAYEAISSRYYKKGEEIPADDIVEYARDVAAIIDAWGLEVEE